jgi:HEAT repeat protein
VRRRSRASVRLGTANAYSVIQQIAWKNGQSRARAAAVEAIGRFYPNDDKALDELVRIARTHPSRDTRSTAVEMVGRLDNPRARQTLDAIIADGSDVAIAAARVESLARRDERRHRQPPARDCAHASLDRGAASGRREPRAPRRQRRPLLSIAKSDVPEDVQRQAVESLGRIDDARVKGMLLELARTHPSIDVERQAVESLGRLDVDVMPDLGADREDAPSSDVRREAVESMTRRDPDQALPLLEDLLKQPKPKTGT